MRGWFRALTLVAVLAVASAACTSSTEQTANNTPASSPSATASPSPSASPSESPSASPTSAPTPAGTGLPLSLPVHNGEVGVDYLAVTLLASGGTGPYSWTVSSGSLPPGLSLSSDGVLTGSNTTAGQFAFNVKATDSTGATGTGSTTIAVFPPFTVNPRCASQCVVGYQCTTCGRFGTQTGGAGPYTYKVVGGSIPPGMSLSGLALAGPFPAPLLAGGPGVPVDTIGPPRTTALWALSVQATDGFGVSRTVAANFVEFGPLSMDCTNGQICASCFNISCSAQVDYSGGNPADLISVRVIKVCDFNGNCLNDPADVAASVPPGFSASASGGTATISYDCSNSCPNGYARNLVVQLVDHGACVAPQYVNSTNTAIINIDFNPNFG